MYRELYLILAFLLHLAMMVRIWRAVALLTRMGTEFGDEGLGDCLLLGVESMYWASNR